MGLINMQHPRQILPRYSYIYTREEDIVDEGLGWGRGAPRSLQNLSEWH